MSGVAGNETSMGRQKWLLPGTIVLAGVGACSPHGKCAPGSVWDGTKCAVASTTTSAVPAAVAPSGAASAPAAESADRDGAGGRRPDEGGMPEPMRVDVIRKVCAAAPCSGRMARVHVYYAKNRIHRY